jgi:hypothetical protein
MEDEAVVAVHDAREADGRLEEVRRWLVRNGIAAADVVEVMVGLARIERTYRRDRQAEGIAVARRNGVYKGRVKGTTKAKPDRAQDLQAKGMSAPEIGRALGVSTRTVSRSLAAGPPAESPCPSARCKSLFNGRQRGGTTESQIETGSAACGRNGTRIARPPDGAIQKSQSGTFATDDDGRRRNR